MDVKESEQTKPVAGREASEARPNRQRSIAGLNAQPVTRAPEPVALHVANNQNKQTNDVRSRANAVINIINVAEETTHEIGRLVKSIHGIAEQAKSNDFPEQRRPVLEAEANELVEEIKRRAHVAASGVKPLAGEEIQLEIDEKIGAALSVKLPDVASGGFGFGRIELGAKEKIESVVAVAADAQKQLETLQGAIEEAHGKVQDSLGALDVALQNSEASQASIRDVEEAVRLAGRTGSQIGKYPDDALRSVGRLDRAMLNLLNS